MYDQLNEYEQKPRSLKKDAAFVYAGYFLRYLSLIVLIPYYGRVLGPASYGNVLAAMSLMNIIWMVVNYGFSTNGAREMAAATTRSERSRIFGRQITARFLLIPIGILIGIAGTAYSPVLKPHIWFGVLATLQGLLAAFNLGWFFQGVRRFRTGMAVEVLSYPLTLCFVLLLVHDADDGANVFVALVLSSIICLITAYAYSRRSSGMVLQGVKAALGEVKSSSIIFLMSVSGMIMTSGSTYLLSLLASPEQVGYFGSAERFIALGFGLMGPAAQVLMPTISNLHGGDTQKAFRLARMGMLLQLCYGLMIVLCGVLFSPFVLPLIMGKEFIPSVPILQILSCLFPFAAFAHACGMYVFIPLRKEKYLIIATATGVSVNLILAFFLAQHWGAIGMAIARVCGEAISSSIVFILMLRLGYLQKVIRGHR